MTAIKIKQAVGNNRVVPKLSLVPIKNIVRRAYGNSTQKDSLQEYIDSEATFLAEDLDSGAIHTHSTYWSSKNKCDVQVITLTSRLAAGVLLRNWFWIVGAKVELVNSEIKFKLNSELKRYLGVVVSAENKQNKSSEYINIGGGKTKLDFK